MGGAMATVSVVAAGSGDTYRIERVHLHWDQVYGFAPDAMAPREPVDVQDWEVAARPAACDGPQLAGACVPIIKRLCQIRHRDDAFSGCRSGRPRTRRGAQGGGGGRVRGTGRGAGLDTIVQVRTASTGVRGNDFHPGVQKMETTACHNSTLPLPVRDDAGMDQDALGRLGHHIVSRRVALGFRTRTDLANSLKFTVRTLADIENGVRKASAGTYAMLENKLGWAPGSIDTILAGGEPHELVIKLRREGPEPRYPGTADALARASTEELLLELRRRIIRPRERRPQTWEDWDRREARGDWDGLDARGDWPEEG
jgi:hypothetical protein